MAESYRPTLSLSLLNPIDEAENERVQQKLADVCLQFLNWELHDELAVQKTARVTETLVLCCRPTRDKGQMAAAPQWSIVEQFLQGLKATQVIPEDPQNQTEHEVESMNESFDETSDAPSDAPSDEPSDQPTDEAEAAAVEELQSARLGGPARVRPPRPAWPATASNFAPSLVSAMSRPDTTVEVIDLPTDGGTESILTAILRQNHGQMIECPIRAPMCDGARLAITRDRGIVLLAVAREGLSELRAIGQAYRWISENRALIAMAIPQFAIDAHRTPMLRLLVDHADASADVLQQIMQAEHVTIQAYRKLRWGKKTGLFLEAA